MSDLQKSQDVLRPPWEYLTLASVAGSIAIVFGTMLMVAFFFTPWAHNVGPVEVGIAFLGEIGAIFITVSALSCYRESKSQGAIR